jgi:hypothetical protein
VGKQSAMAWASISFIEGTGVCEPSFHPNAWCRRMYSVPFVNMSVTKLSE